MEIHGKIFGRRIAAHGGNAFYLHLLASAFSRSGIAPAVVVGERVEGIERNDLLGSGLEGGTDGRSGPQHVDGHGGMVVAQLASKIQEGGKNDFYIHFQMVCCSCQS